MAVFDGDEPGPRHWSRRVHVLERVADGVPATNAYPAFASWENKPARRHLFETYATARGPSLFLPKDRLLLTKRLLDERLLLDVLVEQGLVPACFPLHAASEAVWKSNLQPDFNVRVCDRFDASSSAVLRELDESNRFVQKSAESASI